jgi:16S rRNA (cytosine967-C5)-methyltransferase
MPPRRPSSPARARPGARQPARAAAPAALWARASQVLDAVEAGRPADRALGDAFAGARLAPEARAAVADLVLGVVRLKAQLDWWLGHVRHGGGPRARLLAHLILVDGIDPADVADVCGRHPDLPPLAPSEAQLVKGLARRTLFHPNQPAWVQANVPEWVMARLEARFGARAGAEAAALSAQAGLDLRANALMAGREAVANALKGDRIRAVPTPLSPHGLRVAGRPPIARTRAYQKGLVEVQDEGSQLAALLVDARPGERVLDLCAGACGKTLAIAAAMENKGRIVACDVHDRRLADAATRLRRADVHNVTRRLIAGARDPWLDRHKGDFDRVLVDAPCTGTGTWRRNPDAKWRVSPTDLDELVALQASLLDAGARAVKPGGRLVYATCSVLDAENGDQVVAFLARRPDFAAVPVPEAWAEVLPGACPVPGPWLELTPARHGTDGFFVAILVRRPAAPADGTAA